MNTLSDEMRQGMQYEVFKDHQGHYLFVAFNPQSIKARLISQGLDITYLKKLYLTQSFFKESNAPILVTENAGLVPVDGVWVMLPINYISAPKKPLRQAQIEVQADAEAINIPGLKSFDLLAYKIPLIAAASMLFMIMLFHEINLNRAQSIWEQKMAKLQKSYALPATQIQLKAIMKRLKKIDHRQSFIRDSLYKVSKMRTTFQGGLAEISINEKSMNLRFDNVPNALKPALLKTFKKAHIKRDKETMHVEVIR